MEEEDYLNAIAPYQDALKVLMDHVSLVKDGQGNASLRLKGGERSRTLTDREFEALNALMDCEACEDG